MLSTVSATMDSNIISIVSVTCRLALKIEKKQQAMTTSNTDM